MESIRRITMQFNIEMVYYTVKAMTRMPYIRWFWRPLDGKLQIWNVILDFSKDY